MTTRRYSGIKLVIASVGIILVIGGLAVVGFDVSDARGGGPWGSQSLLDALTGVWMEEMYLGYVADWLRRPQFLAVVHRPIVVLLDLIPQWAAMIAAGAVIVWRALK